MTSRDKIMEAADSLFGENGFNATSTREIAERSGVNKALIHYHFKSKEALLQSLLDKYYEELIQEVSAPILQVDGARSRVMRLIDVYSDFLSRNRNFIHIVQREATGGKNMDLIRDRTIPMFQIGLDFLKKAFPETKSGALAAEHLLVSFYGMIITYFTYGGVLENLLDTDTLSEENLKTRKEHLYKMADIVLKEFESA